ncbi:hypothetical protein ACIQVK_53990, partial [Streptomyces sp. NPDC090493]
MQFGKRMTVGMMAVVAVEVVHAAIYAPEAVEALVVAGRAAIQKFRVGLTARVSAVAAGEAGVIAGGVEAAMAGLRDLLAAVVVDAAQYAAFGGGMNAGLDLLVQLSQVAEGTRDGIDGEMLLSDLELGAIGGAVAGGVVGLAKGLGGGGRGVGGEKPEGGVGVGDEVRPVGVGGEKPVGVDEGVGSGAVDGVAGGGVVSGGGVVEEGAGRVVGGGAGRVESGSSVVSPVTAAVAWGVSGVVGAKAAEDMSG